MSKKQKQVEQGLGGLLASATPQEQETKKQAHNYVTVCYNIHPDLAENIKRVAKYEGKRANIVVSDALRFYFEHWRPVPQEKPTLIL